MALMNSITHDCIVLNETTQELAYQMRAPVLLVPYNKMRQGGRDRRFKMRPFVRTQFVATQ